MARYEDQFDDDYRGDEITPDEPHESEAFGGQRMNAKQPLIFNQKCGVCGRSLPKGTPPTGIVYDVERGAGPGGRDKWTVIAHPGCPGAGTAAPTPTPTPGPSSPAPRADSENEGGGKKGYARPTYLTDERVRKNAEVLWNGGIDTTGDLSGGKVGTTRFPLDDEQKRISLWRPHIGPVRVLAAAGSGKTSTTVGLVARLIWDGVLKPSEIIVTTFTNKAAAELRSRFAQVITGAAFEDLRLGTFHSLAFAVKKHNKVLRDRMPHTKFLDPSGARARWRQILDEVWSKESAQGYVTRTNKQSLGQRLRDLNDGEPVDVKGYMTAITVARSAPGDYDAVLARLYEGDTNAGVPRAVDQFPLIDEAWKIYVESLRNTGEWDFDTIVAEWEMALATGEVKSSARLVIVDEAQDNNRLQASIAMKVAKNGKGSVILVGDVRQSIYAWRGAEPEIMITADQVLGAKTMEITTNYRSGSKIVELGNAICAGKDYAVGQPSKPGPGAKPGLVTITGAEDVVGEAEVAAQRIVEAMAGKPKEGYSEFAILGRTRAQGGAAEAALVAKKIPCAIVGGTPFFKRDEAVATLAWIKALSGLKIDAKEMQKLGRYPASGITVKYAEEVVSRLNQGEDFATATDMATPVAGKSGKWRQAAEDFANNVSVLSDKIAKSQGTPETRWAILIDEIGAMFNERFAATAKNLVTEDEDEKGDPGSVVLSLAKSFPGPAALMQFAARCANETVELDGETTQDDLPPGRVIISTIHKAKGLEWPVVFVSASQDQFPHKRSANVPEEERCFYVAVTRAKNECHLTYASEVNGKPAGPSPFLDYAAPFTATGIIG
jgi:DNA helicase-2/ATP-dependent DNA helicase PcrA